MRIYKWNSGTGGSCSTGALYVTFKATASTYDLSIMPALTPGAYQFAVIADDGTTGSSSANTSGCPWTSMTTNDAFIKYQYKLKTAPTISTVALGTLPNTVEDEEILESGINLDIIVTFNQNVDVSGTPRILLNTTPARYANYLSGTGSKILTFRYTVQAGDSAADFDYVDVNSLSLNGGTLKGSYGLLDANLTLPTPGSGAGDTGNSVGDSHNIKILLNYGAYVTSVTYAGGALTSNVYKMYGESIDVKLTFSQAVTVTGTPRITLSNYNGSAQYFNYQSGSGTNELIFRYTINSYVNYLEGISLLPVELYQSSTIQSTSGSVDAYLKLRHVDTTSLAKIFITSTPSYGIRTFASEKHTLITGTANNSVNIVGYARQFAPNGYSGVTEVNALSPATLYASQIGTSHEIVQVEENFNPQFFNVITSYGGATYSNHSASASYGCYLNRMGALSCYGQIAHIPDPHPYSSSSYNYFAPSSSNFRIDHVSQFSIGYQHGCVIINGYIKCWGYSVYGQLGGGQADTSTIISNPVNSDSTNQYKFVSAGSYVTCGITIYNELKCWGLNSAGQITPNSTAVLSYNEAQTIDAGQTYKYVLASQNSTSVPMYAITTAGVLKKWGAGLSAITDVDNSDTYTMISSNTKTFCAISATTSKVKCWGANLGGVLARKSGSYLDYETPTEIEDTATYKHVSVGPAHVCGTTTSDQVKCWGSNIYGQLGNGLKQSSMDMTEIPMPVAVAKMKFFDSSLVQLSGVSNQNLIKGSNGQWYSWGAMYAVTGSQITPTPFNLPNGLIDFAVNSFIDGSGQLNHILNTGDLSSAVIVDSGVSYVRLEGYCGLTTTQKLKCWNSPGGMTPTLVDNDDYLDFDGNGSPNSIFNYCAINTSHQLKCWGDNRNGNVGIGDSQVSWVTNPTVIDSGVSYAKVIVNNNACAITTSGILKCWGYPYQGGVGNGNWNYQNVYAPMEIDAGVTYTTISAMKNSMCGITSLGALKCWGGTLSNGSNPDSVPRSPTVLDVGVTYVGLAEGNLYNGSMICGFTSTGKTKCREDVYGSNGASVDNISLLNGLFGNFFSFPTVINGL